MRAFASSPRRRASSICARSAPPPRPRSTRIRRRISLANRTLDGVESDIHSIVTNGYATAAPYLPSNLALFAKTETIVIRRDVLSRLSSADRDAVQAAATVTVAHADPAAQERTEIGELCDQGLQLVTAAQSDVDALRAASESVYATLERDPATKQAITAIETLAGNSTTVGVTLPACPQSTATTTTQPASSTPFPEGVFQSRLLPADFVAGGATVDPAFPVPWTITH